MLCNNSNSMNQFLNRSGEKLFRIGLLILKSCMHQWTLDMTIKMSSKTFLADTLLLKKIKHPQKDQFRLRLNGSEVLRHGWKEFAFCIRIVIWNSSNIGKLLWNCFKQFRIGQVLPYNLT